MSSVGGVKSGSKMFMQGWYRHSTENKNGTSWKISNNCMDTFMSTSKSLHPKIKTSETPVHLQVDRY